MIKEVMTDKEWESFAKNYNPAEVTVYKNFYEYIKEKRIQDQKLYDYLDGIAPKQEMYEANTGITLPIDFKEYVVAGKEYSFVAFKPEKTMFKTDMSCGYLLEQNLQATLEDALEYPIVYRVGDYTIIQDLLSESGFFSVEGKDGYSQEKYYSDFLEDKRLPQEVLDAIEQIAEGNVECDENGNIFTQKNENKNKRRK